jgi:hypothetical protein
MDNKSKVLLFIRPSEHPAAVIDEQHVRISYRNKWIDFKKGKIIISDELDYDTAKKHNKSEDVNEF